VAKDRVVVAMSGGVDSSVAAARLADAGYEVVGVTLHLWDYPEDGAKWGRCCAPEDQHDARRVADRLGIAHYTFDRRALFAERVVQPFVEAYLAGKTPSPCVACNRSVKIRELLPLADRLDAKFVATGHYARVVTEAGRARLYRGRDRRKDQSYFLHMLRADELERLLLPLGDLTKEEVRADALSRDLPGAKKGESQELCFVSTGRYDAFVEARAAGRMRPGPILDSDGRMVGEHGGIHKFTVGQRKGIGVALGKPAFVVSLDAETSTVTLGEEDGLLAGGVVLGDDAVFADDVELPREVTLQVRARHAGATAWLGHEKGRLVARFHERVRAVSPGQVAVAFVGDRVLGGATILSATPPDVTVLAQEEAAVG
jgi:tRNA-specific 2-thiouridylase